MPSLKRPRPLLSPTFITWALSLPTHSTPTVTR